MRPNRHNQVMSNDRRLNAGGKAKVLANPQNSQREVARRSAELEKSREALAAALTSYIKFLTDKTLPANRTIGDREQQSALLTALPKLALDLNKKNVEEGTQVMAATGLNSILVLRDELNKVRYQNHFLNQEIAKLTARVDILEGPIPDPTPEDDLIGDPIRV